MAAAGCAPSVIRAPKTTRRVPIECADYENDISTNQTLSTAEIAPRPGNSRVSAKPSPIVRRFSGVLDSARAHSPATLSCPNPLPTTAQLTHKQSSAPLPSPPHLQLLHLELLRAYFPTSPRFQALLPQQGWLPWQSRLRRSRSTPFWRVSPPRRRMSWVVQRQ